MGGIGAQTQVQYDALDRLVQMTDPSGLNTAYSYNGFGDVLGLSSPDTGTTTSTYDSVGNLKTRTDARNLTATYGYDPINRVTSVTYPDTSRNLGFVYDAAPVECPTGERFHVGRVARMTDASGSTALCYDRFGNLTRKVQATQGRSFTVRYDHAPRVRTGSDAPMRPRAPVWHHLPGRGADVDWPQRPRPGDGPDGDAGERPGEAAGAGDGALPVRPGVVVDVRERPVT